MYYLGKIQTFILTKTDNGEIPSLPIIMQDYYHISDPYGPATNAKRNAIHQSIIRLESRGLIKNNLLTEQGRRIAKELNEKH